jgi:pimeloyl-ACP methyl ester carboxylesterase
MALAGILKLDGRRIAYRDTDGDGPSLLALHGHFGHGGVFDRLADSLTPGWRVVAPDQRGHGASDRAPDYDRDGYVADAAYVIEALDLAPTVVLGHSLGGVNAYQLAARRPELVRAVIVEDAPAEFGERVPFDAWPETLPPRSASPETALEDVNRSRRLLTGDYWADWLAGEHPVLLLHGVDSDTLLGEQAREMAKRRWPNTRLVDFPHAGHEIHDDDPEGFALAVASFLEELG